MGDFGALSGSCPTGQAPTGLDASRCDPARVEIERVAAIVRSPTLDWPRFQAALEVGAHLEAAMMLVPEGWQYEVSNNAIDRGWSRSVGPDGPDDTIEELGPWCSLQRPVDRDCWGHEDWFGVINCGGSGGADVPTAVALAVLNIYEKGHLTTRFASGMEARQGGNEVPSRSDDSPPGRPEGGGQ